MTTCPRRSSFSLRRPLRGGRPVSISLVLSSFLAVPVLCPPPALTAEVSGQFLGMAVVPYDPSGSCADLLPSCGPSTPTHAAGLGLKVIELYWQGHQVEAARFSLNFPADWSIYDLELCAGVTPIATGDGPGELFDLDFGGCHENAPVRIGRLTLNVRSRGWIWAQTQEVRQCNGPWEGTFGGGAIQLGLSCAIEAVTACRPCGYAFFDLRPDAFAHVLVAGTSTSDTLQARELPPCLNPSNCYPEITPCFGGPVSEVSWAVLTRIGGTPADRLYRVDYPVAKFPPGRYLGGIRSEGFCCAGDCLDLDLQVIAESDGNRQPVARIRPFGAEVSPITFDGTGSFDLDGSPLAYRWDFGDGTTSTDPTPSHTFAALGAVSVTLVVFDGALESTADVLSIEVLPNRPPVADAGPPLCGAAGGPVVFDGAGSHDPDDQPIEYTWDFGDGASGGGVAPAHTYADPGAYTVALRVFDGSAWSVPDLTEATILPTAALLRVPEDYPTIAAAINSARDSCAVDTILVAPGHYLESGLALAHNVVIRGTGGALATIVDAGRVSPVLSVAGPGRVEIEGLSLIRGSGAGGGVVVGASGDMVLRDVVVDSCQSSSVGGGVRTAGGRARLERVTIRNCTASSAGGAIAVTNGGEIEVRETVITDCAAQVFAGGVYVLDGEADLEGLTIAFTTRAALHARPAATVRLVRSILAYATQHAAVRCDFGAAVELDCIDFWGNGAGNTQGCPSPTNSITLDPQFCDLAGRDFHLHAESPCAPEHSPPGCGLIGALPPACTTVDVEPTETAGAPTLPFALEVLNPLRPGAGRVHFTLPHAARVHVDVFDVTGRHLRVLAEGSFRAGRHAVPWEERHRGSVLPAGVVFLRLTAEGGHQMVKKVAVLR